MSEFIEPIQHATFIRASPECVYDAFTRGEEMDRWFTSGADIDARPGGAIRFRWRDWGPDRVTAEDGGPVLEATSPQRFVFQWSPDTPDYATTVTLTFAPTNGGTIVRVHEKGFRDTAGGRSAALGCAAGWGEALTLTKFYVEHGATY